MSLLRRPLNLWLRTVEKRRMRKGDVATLRRALEVQSRLLFYPPRGNAQSWTKYGGVPCLKIPIIHQTKPGPNALTACDIL